MPTLRSPSVCTARTMTLAKCRRHSGARKQRAAGAAYCQANSAACDLQGQQTALTVLVAIEVALTAVTLVDFVPGDEIAAGGATAATFSRLSAIPQEIAALEAAALRGETTIQRSPAQSRVELGRNLVEAASRDFVPRATAMKPITHRRIRPASEQARHARFWRSSRSILTRRPMGVVVLFLKSFHRRQTTTIAYSETI